MSGFEIRVNGETVCVTPFAEEDGESGVLLLIVEWMLLRNHEICWLVLDEPLKELFPGDEVSVRIIEGFVATTLAKSANVSYRVLPSKPCEIAIEVRHNGAFLRQVQSARAADAQVT